MAERIYKQEKIKDDLSLFDILVFLTESWKIILSFGLAGVLISGAYLAVKPPQYEAKAIIEMAQHDSNSNSNSNIPLLATSIEAPALLRERLKTPTTYSPAVISACGLDNNAHPAQSLAKMVKVTPLNKLTSVVAITINRDSPDLAKQCLVAVFELIREQQQLLKQPYRDQINTQLRMLETRLQQNQKALMAAEKSELHKTIYLAQHDEHLFLLKQIEELRSALLSNSPTRLVTPVYDSTEPVFTKLMTTLILSLIMGLLLGLFLALIRRSKLYAMSLSKNIDKQIPEEQLGCPRHSN